MTFERKFTRTSGRIVAVYTCPEHGEFDADVERDANGEAPDVITCGAERGVWADAFAPSGEMHYCECPATWTPSPVGCRVRRVEVTRGKYEKPERPTYLDTRKLGEGQDPEEFAAERQKIWRRKREAEVMEIKRGGG